VYKSDFVLKAGYTAKVTGKILIVSWAITFLF
jgi:hypothetical protein